MDHKRIGLMYLAATLFFFLWRALAIALRTELFAGQDFMSAQTYNQVFTLHGRSWCSCSSSPRCPPPWGFLLPLMLGATSRSPSSTCSASTSTASPP